MGDTGFDVEHGRGRSRLVVATLSTVAVALLLVAGVVGVRLALAGSTSASTVADAHDGLWSGGTKSVRYRGIEVDVPRALSVETLHCGNQTSEDVPVSAAGAVQMGAPWTSCSAIEGQHPFDGPLVHLEPVVDAEATPTPSVSTGSARTFADQQVVVTVSGGDEDFARRVLASARVAPIEASGCPTRAPARTDYSTVKAPTPLLTGAVDAALVCVYTFHPPADAEWPGARQDGEPILTAHAALTTAETADLARRVITARQYEASVLMNGCGTVGGASFGLLRFSAGDGAPQDVVVRSVSNGDCADSLGVRDGRAVVANSFAADAMLTVPADASGARN